MCVPYINRDEQIRIARKYVESLIQIGKVLKEMENNMRGSLKTVEFEEDVSDCLWSVIDNTYHIPDDIKDAIQPIVEMSTDEEIEERRQNRRDEMIHRLTENSAFFRGLQ